MTTFEPDDEGKGGDLALEQPDQAEEQEAVADTEDTGEADIPVADWAAEENGGRHRFWPPTRGQVLTGVAFGSVILLGALLRFWGLGDKPVHHDESMHAYFSMQLMHQMGNWIGCFNKTVACYTYNPLLHGPFQFHAIAFFYKLGEIFGAPDHGVNNTTLRIAAATSGTVIVGLPYFLRDRLGTVGAWLACFLLAVSPSMVYYSRFAREDIYMACFTLLLVVGVARYLRGRKLKWLLLAALGFALSYATKEATFLTVAVFGSFMGALLVWELGVRRAIGESASEGTMWARFRPHTAAPVALLAYFVVLGVFAKVFFGWLKDLSIYITTHTKLADQYVLGLKEKTLYVVPVLGLLLGVYVMSILWRESRGEESFSTGERRRLAAWVDPQQQPLLDTLLTMPWTHWFFALIVGWLTFLVLFTVLFTNIAGGVADGIWQGIYYWLQQQQVARGGQPWYYYLLLIPLYEQIGLVFGLVGLVRCLLRPTRFQLFLVYWFIGNVFIYSWAAEKMPWLTIHMTMPLMLLAAIGLEPAVVTLLAFVKRRLSSANVEAAADLPVRRKVGVLAGSGAALTVLLALLLLLPTLQNMYQLSQVHQADAPHEMMIYVQTTTDVNAIMNKVDALDQKLYGGAHKLTIGVLSDGTWPFAWYLRDYSNVCFNFPQACPDMAKSAEVIIAGGDDLPGVVAKYNSTYVYHQYHMRTQWDQGYMPPQCKPSPTDACTDPQPYVGVGPWLWLSYGDNPPPGASFNIALATNNIWQWWWTRKAFGSTDGSYDMGLLIRNDLATEP